MKIYLVCWTDMASEHSPYYVEKVFLSEESAKKFISNLKVKGSSTGMYGDPWVDERDIS
jgi:hypothetical protein